VGSGECVKRSFSPGGKKGGGVQLALFTAFAYRGNGKKRPKRSRGKGRATSWGAPSQGEELRELMGEVWRKRGFLEKGRPNNTWCSREEPGTMTSAAKRSI